MEKDEIFFFFKKKGINCSFPASWKELQTMEVNVKPKMQNHL